MELIVKVILSKSFFLTKETFLEKIFNLEIIIASHPKSKEEGRLDYLGNRTAVLNRTEELVKGSEFVIGVFSTAYVYAIVYQKPIFFILAMFKVSIDELLIFGFTQCLIPNIFC